MNAKHQRDRRRSGRRGNGEGSVYQRGSTGRWVAALTLPNGRRRTKLADSHADALVKLRELLDDQRRGAVVSSETVADCLRHWLKTIDGTVAPATFERYWSQVEVHAIPALGRVRLDRLTPEHFEALYHDKLAAKLAPRTVGHLHAVLRIAFNHAVRRGLLPTNPVALVRPPRPPAREIRALTAAQVRALLTAAARHRFEALFVLAVTTGMRQGELMALRWADIDLAAGTVQVRGSVYRERGRGLSIGPTKTKGSRRRILLPASAVRSLRRHRTRQARERRQATVWTDLGLLFPNTVGKLMSPGQMVERYFHPLLVEASSLRSTSTCYGTLRQRCCWRRGSIPRSSRSSSGTPASA
ncbi:MAG TPA: tyrosine-type recombinase/integrase [Actinomycetes bacterium]|nr:tyrosine-type recombinase/integrase [Actinomycetes bacterium]